MSEKRLSNQQLTELNRKIQGLARAANGGGFGIKAITAAKQAAELSALVMNELVCRATEGDSGGE